MQPCTGLHAHAGFRVAAVMAQAEFEPRQSVGTRGFADRQRNPDEPAVRGGVETGDAGGYGSKSFPEWMLRLR